MCRRTILAFGRRVFIHVTGVARNYGYLSYYRNMDSENLSEAIEYFGSSGIVLSTEKKSCLQTSLVLIAKDYKFIKVKFWGVIRGIHKEYYIIQGVKKDEIIDRTALYSLDCMDWKLLPIVDEGLRVKSSLIIGRFTGDPDHMAEHNVIKRLGEGVGMEESTTTVEMKEVDRLAATIAKIDEEMGVVPMGAYLRTPLNQVIVNKSFTGLSPSEAKQLKYYLHFKEPEDSDANKVITQSIDFLPNLDKDIPQGSWSIQCDQGGAVVILRSLKWVGFVSYHIPNSSKYGYLYCGTGEKNSDLLFML